MNIVNFGQQRAINQIMAKYGITCDWANHERLAEDYFGKKEYQLEEKGWIKVFRSFELGIPVYCQPKVSPQQRIWLEDHNVEYYYC